MAAKLLYNFVFFITGCLTTFHPVHVSVTNIEINTSRQEMNYSIRIFSDDFVYALEHFYEKDILLADGISETEKEIVMDYVNSMFEIDLNGSKCVPECRKIEKMDISLWIHCNVLLAEKEISSLKVINKLMLDFFIDQTNLIIIDLNGKQMGYTLDYLNQEAEIHIN